MAVGGPRFQPGEYPKGLIAIPAMEVMWTRAAMAIAHAVRRAPASAIARIDYCQLPTIEKRNWYVEEFLKQPDMRWLLFLDSDMVPPSDIVQRLLDAGSGDDVDAVSALCYTRHAPPYRICAGPFGRSLRRDELTQGLQEVEWVGTGAVLLWREVLETLAGELDGVVYRPREDERFPRGEDEQFCHDALDNGFRVWVHSGVEVGHVGLTNITHGFASHFTDDVPSGPREPCWVDISGTASNSST